MMIVGGVGTDVVKLDVNCTDVSTSRGGGEYVSTVESRHVGRDLCGRIWSVELDERARGDEVDLVK